MSNYPRILFELLFLKRVDYKEKEETYKEQTINEESKKEKIVKKEDINKKEKEEKSEKISNDYKTPIINNTISLANNNSKKEVQNILQNLDKHIVNKKYKIAATILNDAMVVAASDDHVGLAYKYACRGKKSAN